MMTAPKDYVAEPHVYRDTCACSGCISMRHPDVVRALRAAGALGHAAGKAEALEHLARAIDATCQLRGAENTQTGPCLRQLERDVATRSRASAPEQPTEPIYLRAGKDWCGCVWLPDGDVDTEHCPPHEEMMFPGGQRAPEKPAPVVDPVREAATAVCMAFDAGTEQDVAEAITGLKGALEGL